MVLKDIALELLNMYVMAETTVIYEYSGDVDFRLDELAEEEWKYRKKIEEEAEKLERMLTR